MKSFLVVFMSFITFLSRPLTSSSPSPVSEPFSPLSWPLDPQTQLEVQEFLSEQSQPHQDFPAKCRSSSSSLLHPFSSPTSQTIPSLPGSLLLFISFSVPLPSWKEHSLHLEKTGGAFVLQGLPQNSFSLLSQKLQELRNAGILAQILLDPPAFESYQITAVPTLVLKHDTLSDQISGNLQIPAALAWFARQGSLPALAQQYLDQLDPL